MDLAAALGGFNRAPSDYRAERLSEFLHAWRLLVESHPISGGNPSFLSFLNEQEASRLSEMGKQHTLRKGQRIYQRGENAISFGLVLQGSLLMTDMQDLRIRPATTATRPGTRAGAGAGPTEEHCVLQVGDTFGEIPLALDGQIVSGRRESTLHASEDDVEVKIFTIDYRKFAAFLEELPASRQAPFAMASRLLPKVLPNRHSKPPWLANARVRGDGSVAASEEFSPIKNRKKSKVLDAPPVTMLNMDVLMECAFVAKRAEGVVSDTTRAIVGKETRFPHTVVFHNGELVHWYFGWLSSVKRRSKEHLTAWQLLEDFCKGSESGQVVAVMTCCKRGNNEGQEHAQCRLLTRRKLETVVSGAKANQLTGYIQKYHRTERAVDTEYVLQCNWSTNSFTVDWVPESMVECLTHSHRPARMDPGGNKKLHEKMNVKYHHYVAGNLSQLGDHFNSQMIKMNPLEQLDGRSKARARQFNDGTDAKAGNIVERDIRDTVKTACQQIAAMFDKTVNKSDLARQKAIDDAIHFTLHHSPAFTLIRTMTCFFKVNKEGVPALLHCTAAVAHPETRQPLTAVSRAELLNPSEETFLFFAGYGGEHSRLSGLGERALLLDFSEFLQLLIKKDLLYNHVSMTDASLAFKHACNSLSAEEGQLKYPEYCECMLALRERMGLDEAGKPKYQAGIRRTHSVENQEQREADIDERLAGVMIVRKQQEQERGRLGGMFAASIVEKQAIEDVSRRAAERDRKHEERAAALRRKVALAAAAERKALEEHRQKAQAQAAKKQQEKAESAQKSWERIEKTNQMLMEERDAAARKLQAETESRRQASIEKLKLRRQAEEHRLSEMTKRSELLENHRAKVYSKKAAVVESTKDYKYIAVREKEVVRGMFHDYVRTGHLARPWGLIDLSGDALPSLIEIATEKSKGHADAKRPSLPGDVGAGDVGMLSVLGDKHKRTKHRSHSSMN
jgi:CRP-like cAMP-binding protein